MSVKIMSEPIMYTDLSDCNTPFLRSNVAESVTVLTSPDASAGSVYSTWRISPCKIQKSSPA